MNDYLELLRRGEFTAAWRLRDGELARGEMGVWNGEPLDGKRVLIRCEHTLGDTIQFIRYVPLVKRITSRVSVSAQPELLPLLETMNGIDDLLREGATGYDLEVESMELPHVFRTRMKTIPRDVPYLLAANRDSRIANREDFRVGIAWGDIPFELIMALADVPGVALHVLQRELAPGEGDAPFIIPPERCEPLGMAQLMRALDLVISVDTMPAHLAGALGVPVWTLLPADADWRWMEGRDDSPWYPTMRLFRQPSPGAWEPVVARVSDALRRAARVAA